MSVDERVQPLGSSRCDLRRSQDEEDEEDELRMLAILKREQEEGDGDMGGPGLSASQVGNLYSYFILKILYALYGGC